MTSVTDVTRRIASHARFSDRRTVRGMAGRHRRPPAWRRLLLRLTRSDRAARRAALQAEVVALRATVLALRAELDAVQVSVSTAAGPSPLEMRWVTLNLPLLRAALEPVAPVEPASIIELDLREHAAGGSGKELVLADLPEAALLDPRHDRGVELVGGDTDIDADTDAGAGAATGPEAAPIRRIA